MASIDSTGKRSPRGGSTGSNKVLKSDGKSSPSGKNKEEGFADLNSKLRSCLRSPLALPLIMLLHDDDENIVGGLPSDFGEIIIEDIKSKRFDNAKKHGENAFREAMLNWDSKIENEKVFTDTYLASTLENEMKNLHNNQVKNLHNNQDETIEGSQGSTSTTDSAKSLPTKVIKQMYISGLNQNKSQKGYCDILSWERSRHDNSIAYPIYLLEIGKSTYDWWEKIGQAHDYVAMMRTPGVKITEKQINSCVFSYPMIISAIILEGKKGKEVYGDFGTFLCIPVGDDDFRVVLLRRKRVSNLETATKEFGKVIQASFALRKWRQSGFMKKMKKMQFECLGPNCAKVGNRVSFFFVSYFSRPLFIPPSSLSVLPGLYYFIFPVM